MTQDTARVIDAQEMRIGKQIVLPLSKAIEISAKSVKLRIGRSLITMSGIILAIAFLTSIWSSGAITDSLKNARDRKVNLLLERKGIAVEAQDVSEEASKNSWLVVLSLLVCVVGIANAMLMSVTERFREIGTMKCLGALDTFIVKLFLIESSFLGIIGTLIGVGIGLVLTILISATDFGSAVFRYFPGTQILRSGLLALVIGSVLSVVAAIYPAYTAAKMEPVAAMRQEA
jgi:predicted lysophospholipase L1 biosynthesis ABC-type transport system permease subunit